MIIDKDELMKKAFRASNCASSFTGFKLVVPIESLGEILDNFETEQLSEEIDSKLIKLQVEFAKLKSDFRELQEYVNEAETDNKFLEDDIGKAPEILFTEPTATFEDVLQHANDFIRTDTVYYNGHALFVETHLNTEKKVVTVLLKTHLNEVMSVGIARCGYNDTFNATIGKSIALHRALDMELPEMYLEVEY